MATQFYPVRTLTTRDEKKSKKGTQPQPPAWRWLTVQLLGLVRQFGNTIIWAILIGYFIKQGNVTLRLFAGTTSVATLLMNIAGHVSLTVSVSVAISVAVTGLYLLEYRRHRKTRERLTNRITQLELQIDPKRSTSGISTEGTTRIGDR